jgi:hypothetical protein
MASGVTDQPRETRGFSEWGLASLIGAAVITIVGGASRTWFLSSRDPRPVSEIWWQSFGIPAGLSALGILGCLAFGIVGLFVSIRKKQSLALPLAAILLSLFALLRLAYDGWMFWKNVADRGNF